MKVIEVGTSKEIVVNVVFSVDPYSNNTPIDLESFTNIIVDIGDETYSLLDTPNNIYLKDSNHLSINIGEVTSLRPSYYNLTITVINSSYPLGYPLTSDCLSNLEAIKVCG